MKEELEKLNKEFEIELEKVKIIYLIIYLINHIGN